MVKSILFFIHLHEFSTLQAPKFALHQLGIHIRKFLWEGRKTKTKKHHLVNWKIVRAPKHHGGLRIRDLGMMNMVMGSKLFWIMTMKMNQWWTQVMREKYLKCHNHGEVRMETTQGSPIWKLMILASDIIGNNLCQIPGKGDTT